MVLDSIHPPRWQVSTVRDLADAEFVDLNLYVAEGVSSAWVGRATGARGAGAARRLFRLYENADRSLFGSGDDVLAASEIPDGAGLPVRLALAKQASGAGRTLLAAESLAALRQASLDVVLLLGAPSLEDELRGVAREGLWVVRFGDPDRSAGGHQFFWQLHRGGGPVEVSLVALDEEAPARVIYRACVPSHSVSLHRARVYAHRSVARFPLRCLRLLPRCGLDGLEARARWLASSVEGPVVERELPSVATLVRHLSRVVARAMRRVLRKRFLREDWHVGFRAHGGILAESLEDLRVVPTPRNHFLADPFLVERGEGHWLFFEDYSYDERKGVISTAGIGAGTRSERSRVALAREHHLSYPCVFEWEGDLFMIPESSQAGQLDLYHANAFPDEWRFEKVLIEGMAAGDPTVLHHDGTLWLFVAVDPSERGSAVKSELLLFSAESPRGPWIPHPLNPVVTDIRRARPAGMIFRRGGDLIRPGQDNSHRYGGGVTLSRIEALSSNEYREVPVGRLGPELAGACGLHTYNADSVYETIDFQRSALRRPLWPNRRSAAAAPGTARRAASTSDP